MKRRDGFVSNSSSSSFMVFNPPDITNMSELVAYLSCEPNAETRRDFDYMLALFQKKAKYTKKEIIEYLEQAIEDGKIPFYEELFEEDFMDCYNHNLINFIINRDDYENKGDENRNILENDLVIDFIKYMGMFFPQSLMKICMERETHDRTEWLKLWDRKYRYERKIYNIFATHLYDKLKAEGKLDSLLIFEVGDDCYPEIEQGYYFGNVDNIIRISNH